MVDTYACGIQVERPEGSLWALADLSPDLSCQEIKRFARGKRFDEMPSKERYAWKALGDDHYHRLYRKTHSTKALFDAGFFDDGLPQLASDYPSSISTFACTSFQKVADNLAKIGSTTLAKLAVLVTTGGMAPIHNGHIAMMEEARRRLQSQGVIVLGGFFAPGHDSYVGQKYGGTAAISAAHRCAMVELAVKDSDWLELDPWAARYMPAEVNFTDVYERMVRLLTNHAHGIDVYYVCGSDNAGFADAIPGQVITIERTAISSKMAREGEHSHLDPLVRDYLVNLNPDTGNLPYLIRNEEDEAIHQWRDIMPGGQEELTRRRIQLQSTIRLGIAQMFKNCGQDHKVHLLPLSEQRAKAEKVIAGRPTISLDPFFESTHAIHSTRYFTLAGAQLAPLFRAERSGFRPLEEQAEDIPQGSYVLVEDDSVTGGTIMSALALLPRRVNVEEVVLLSDFADYKDDSYYDVVDLRDFIVGSYCGGLSVNVPDGWRNIHKARAPYVAPFVSLRSRAKIPAEAEMEISRIIWQANVRFFKDSGITIEHCDLGFRRFTLHLDWTRDTPVEDFCRYYAERLMENLG